MSALTNVTGRRIHYAGVPEPTYWRSPQEWVPIYSFTGVLVAKVALEHAETVLAALDNRYSDEELAALYGAEEELRRRINAAADTLAGLQRELRAAEQAAEELRGLIATAEKRVTQ